jgi:HAD superfamily hydrolase (TIGR01509 family)
MTRLKAIIFDVDGTLADTEELHRQAFNATFTDFDFGWHWSPKVYADLLAISGGKERLAFFAKNNPVKSPGVDFSPSLIAKIHAAKSVHYKRILAKKGLHLRPGVRRLIAEARREGILLAIATCSSVANVSALLDANLAGDWRNWFTVLATADVVPDKKPSPAVYRYALQRLGIKANQCIAIEDTQNGAAAAEAAGIACVVTTNHFTQRHAFDDAALVVEHLGEPTMRMTVTAGESYGKDFVDVDLLRWILAPGPAVSGIKIPRRASPNITLSTTQPIVRAEL